MNNMAVTAYLIHKEGISVNGIAIAAAVLLLVGAGLIFYAARREIEKYRAMAIDTTAERVIAIVGILCLALAGVFAFAASAHAQALDRAVILVATPELDGSPYERAVAVAIPLPSGAHVGVMLNKPLTSKLADAFPEHEPSKAVRDPLYFGGMWNLRAILAIVRQEEAPAAPPLAFPVVPGVWMVFGANAIDKVIETHPNDARYYVGGIAWSEGMLEEQIAKGRIRAVRPADAAILFRTDTSSLYRELAPARLERGQKSALLQSGQKTALEARER